MSRWSFAQRRELECWSSNAFRIGTPAYREAKERFWRSVLDVLAIPIDRVKDTDVLEFGSGPAGLFLIAAADARYVALDPLMDHYSSLYPYMSTYPITRVNKKIEDFHTETRFAYLFGFNALDHVDDINDALSSIRTLCAPDATVVISMNVHVHSFLQRILCACNAILDPLHKHQYTAKQYRNMRERAGFDIVHEITLDKELRAFEDALNDGRTRKRKSLRYHLHPGNLFFSVLDRFGIPRYAHRSVTGDSVYRLVCFTMRPSDAPVHGT